MTCIQLSQELRQPRYLADRLATARADEGHFEEARRLSQVWRLAARPDTAAFRLSAPRQHPRRTGPPGCYMVSVKSIPRFRYPDDARVALQPSGSRSGVGVWASFAHARKDLPRDGSWVTVLASLAFLFLGDVRRPAPSRAACSDVAWSSEVRAYAQVNIPAGLLSSSVRTDDAAGLRTRSNRIYE